VLLLTSAALPFFDKAVNTSINSFTLSSWLGLLESLSPCSIPNPNLGFLPGRADLNFKVPFLARGLPL
jgi:hypothetical protein